MNSNDNQFSNGEITVTYEPKKCRHSGQCCLGLSDVFKTSVIPWIDLDAATTEKIIAQIELCPSGALTYLRVRELSAMKS